MNMLEKGNGIFFYIQLILLLTTIPINGQMSLFQGFSKYSIIRSRLWLFPSQYSISRLRVGSSLWHWIGIIKPFLLALSRPLMRRERPFIPILPPALAIGINEAFVG
jgi:hypothetical protein